MTILSALAERYDRLAVEGKAPVPGFGAVQIAFTVVLDADGGYVTVQDERTGNKLRPASVDAPLPPKRTAGVASGVFWDKTSYVLGRTAVDPVAPPARQARDAERLAKEHAAFLARHEALLADSDDPGCRALLTFLRGWDPARYDELKYAADMLDANVAFRLQGEPGFIHARPAARAALLAEAHAKDAGAQGMCLVTGQRGPIARLHPSIKGVPGAQSSGAALVSFNLDAFNSYGKTQGGNAPVSEAAAAAYATALNILLTPNGTDDKGWATYRNRIRLGSTTVVFWAAPPDPAQTEQTEDLMALLAAPPPPDEATETAPLRQVLQDIAAGMPLRDAKLAFDPATRTYILGLSPNAARLSVRFWIEQSLGELTERFKEHWNDLRIGPPPRAWPPSTRLLLLELAAQGEAENVPDHLAGEITRAILTGLPYPRQVLTQVIVRIRADGKVTALRVALAKAVVVRPLRRAVEAARRKDPAIPEWKDPLVSLDRDEPNIGYRLGRLFALLDYAQYLSVGAVNAGVKDKYFASASATPARVFPSILRNCQNHLSDARKSRDTERGANWADAEIKQVLDGVPAGLPFPPTLSFEDQGRFVVGYYHQRGGRRSDAAGKPAADDTSPATPSED